MVDYFLCGCGQKVDTAGRSPGEVVACPGCGGRMPIPGESPDEFARQVIATAGRPGVFAHVQLDDGRIAPRPSGGWFKRLLRRLGLR